MQILLEIVLRRHRCSGGEQTLHTGQPVESSFNFFAIVLNRVHVHSREPLLWLVDLARTSCKLDHVLAVRQNFAVDLYYKGRKN
jgi:hypothetical protein